MNINKNFDPLLGSFVYFDCLNRNDLLYEEGTNLKNDRILNLVKMIKALPDYVTLLAVALLVVDDLVSQFTMFKILSASAQRTIIVLAIALFIITYYKKMNSIQVSIQEMSGDYQGVVGVLEPYATLDFAEILSRCETVRLLTVAGTKTGNLGNSQIQELLLDSHRKSKVEIILGNPYSEAVKYRYNHDEPTSYEAGLDGIKRRLVWLYNIKEQLPLATKKRISIKVFDNYPTISIIQGDNDIYSGVYAYKMRGADCPIIHANTTEGYGKFLLKHFEKIYLDSMDLDEWINIYCNNQGVEKTADRKAKNDD
jgi:hypothetical protein